MTESALVEVDMFPGASTLPRIDVCPRSEAERHYLSAPKAHTQLGTVIHAFLADALTFGRGEALERAPIEHWEVLACIELERLPAFEPEAYKPEVWIAVHLKTRKSRELGYNLTREEARAMGMPGEIVCGLDVLGLTDDSVVVVDYKTGRGHVQAIEVNKQLRTYGAAAAIHYGKSHVRYSVIRQPPFSSPYWEEAEMNSLEIESHWIWLEEQMDERARLKALAKAGRHDELPPHVTGEHCTYCPAKRGCEAWLRVAHGPTPTLEELRNMTPEQRGESYVLHKQRKAANDLADEYFRAMSADEPLPLPSGQVYGPKKENHDILLLDRVEAELPNILGNADLAHVVLRNSVNDVPTLAKAALRTALVKFALPEGMSGQPFWDGVLERLREARAVMPREEEKWKTYKPVTEKKKKKAA